MVVPPARPKPSDHLFTTIVYGKTDIEIHANAMLAVRDFFGEDRTFHLDVKLVGEVNDPDDRTYRGDVYTSFPRTEPSDV